MIFIVLALTADLGATYAIFLVSLKLANASPLLK
jgi:hypothetical protein